MTKDFREPCGAHGNDANYAERLSSGADTQQLLFPQRGWRATTVWQLSPPEPFLSSPRVVLFFPAGLARILFAVWLSFPYRLHFH